MMIVVLGLQVHGFLVFEVLGFLVFEVLGILVFGVLVGLEQWYETSWVC